MQYKSQQPPIDKQPSRKKLSVILFQKRLRKRPDQKLKHIGQLTTFPNNGCSIAALSLIGIKIAAVVTAIVIPKLTKIQVNMIKVIPY